MHYRVGRYPCQDNCIVWKSSADIIRDDSINRAGIQPGEELRLLAFVKLDLDVQPFGKAPEKFRHKQCPERFKAANSQNGWHHLIVSIHRPFKFSFCGKKPPCRREEPLARGSGNDTA